MEPSLSLMRFESAPQCCGQRFCIIFLEESRCIISNPCRGRSSSRSCPSSSLIVMVFWQCSWCAKEHSPRDPRRGYTVSASSSSTDCNMPTKAPAASWLPTASSLPASRPRCVTHPCSQAFGSSFGARSCMPLTQTIPPAQKACTNRTPRMPGLTLSLSAPKDLALIQTRGHALNFLMRCCTGRRRAGVGWGSSWRGGPLVWFWV